MFLELWKGRGEPLVGKERGDSIKRFSRKCRIVGKLCGREGDGHLGGEMGRWKCRLRAQQGGRVGVQKIQKREQSEQEGGRWMATQK